MESLQCQQSHAPFRIAGQAGKHRKGLLGSLKLGGNWNFLAPGRWLTRGHRQTEPGLVQEFEDGLIVGGRGRAPADGQVVSQIPLCRRTSL